MANHAVLRMRFPNFLEKALTLSYDDGQIYDKRLIEIMTRHGIKGTFNLNSDRYGDPNFPIKESELREIYLETGNEIAVHGVNHLSLAATDLGEGTHSIVNDRENFERITGGIVKGMAYANGSYNDEVCTMLRMCGIKYARTTVSTEKFDMPTDWLRLPATCHHKNPRLMELAHEFIEAPPYHYFPSRKLRLFYLWGHSYEFHNDGNWQVIEEFCSFMGGRDEVWYATNGEIYDYVQAFNRLEYSVLGDVVYNPTVTDIYAATETGTVFIPAGGIWRACENNAGNTK